jgi:pyridoxal biosynthesis lyase PdxS
MLERDGDGLVTVVSPNGGRLSHGTLVEATVRGRLLGIPLLKLDAAIVLVPAATARARFAAAPRWRTAAAGRRLAEAVRRIEEGAEVLTELRRERS